jgi:hypothetical protein
MSAATWSAPTTESANQAGTALNSIADGSTTAIIVDFDNTTAKALYLALWITLGSITPGTGGSISVRLRRLRSGTYEDATMSNVVAAKVLASGAGVKNLAFHIPLPGPFVYGLEVVNNAGVTLAASGNALYSATFGEEIV